MLVAGRAVLAGAPASSRSGSDPPDGPADPPARLARVGVRSIRRAGDGVIAVSLIGPEALRRPRHRAVELARSLLEGDLAPCRLDEAAAELDALRDRRDPPNPSAGRR